MNKFSNDYKQQEIYEKNAALMTVLSGSSLMHFYLLSIVLLV